MASTTMTITTTITTTQAAQVLTLRTIPDWMHKDVHITHGYRPATNSFRQCYHSLWYLHNESVNIWSHLATGIVFVALLVWSVLPDWHGGYRFAESDLRALQAYLLGVTICLFFSAFYHCVNCHSERVARSCLKLDYLGIVANITSTCVSATYFGLHTHSELASRYISAILLCGAATFWAVLDPNMDGPRAAKLRACIFVALGASGFAPMLHAAVVPGLGMGNFALGHILTASALYLTGTIIYVARFPESSWPGKYNIWGASHQIFHILVNFAQVCHLLGLWSVLTRLHGYDSIPNFANLSKMNSSLTMTDAVKTSLYNTIDMAAAAALPLYHDAGRWAVWVLASSFLGLVVYLVGAAIYNVYFHPLAKFPGPKLWAMSRIPYVMAVRRGQYVYRVKELHDRYDSHVIRIAPDQLTFTDGSVWRDVYQRKQGETDFPKHHVWLRPMVNGVNSLLHAADDDHSRMKRVLGHAFSAKALRGQEEFVHQYVDLFVQRMKETIASGENILDVVKWYGWLTFDVVGDMTFGEPFDCLKLMENHPWVTKLFTQFHGAVILATCRFFPGLETLLEWIVPRSVMDLRWELFRRTQEKMTKRLNSDTDRLDFIHYVKRHNDEKGMTRDEIDSSFTSLCIAGGETTGTFLSSATYYLIQNPHAMAKLVSEIRDTFAREEDMSDSRLEELPYLGAVIKETLRLAPPLASGHPRQVPAGGRHVGGHFLPENTVVEVVNWAAMRSAKNFRDPDSFIPERWLVHNGFDDHNAWGPFSLGPRGCIGRPLANVEMRVILARVLWNFDLQVPGGGDKVGWEWSSQDVFLVWNKRPLYVEVKVVGTES